MGEVLFSFCSDSLHARKLKISLSISSVCFVSHALRNGPKYFNEVRLQHQRLKFAVGHGDIKVGDLAEERLFPWPLSFIGVVCDIATQAIAKVLRLADIQDVAILVLPTVNTRFC